MSAAAEPVLSVRDLTVTYTSRGRTSTALHSVGFELGPGETLGLVGASGSGKSTTALAVVRMLPHNARIESGRITLQGRPVESLGEKQMSGLRGRDVGFIPQDPMLSLNPIVTVGRQVEESLLLHTDLDRAARRARVVELLDECGIGQPEMRARQHPHELSGGMRQRVLIAIAIACNPRLIIADEPTSALDVTVQRAILAQLRELRERHGVAMLMITHDLAVASEQCQRIAVMEGGRVVETGSTGEVLERPRATYTRQLMAAAPSLGGSALVTSGGEVPEPLVEVTDLRKTVAV
ncbi:MAG: ABC transporter ATP-binding protein [Acidimicrobiia bacterium]